MKIAIGENKSSVKLILVKIYPFFFIFIYFFFLSLAEARLDGPFHPAEQDKVHFGTPAFNFDRPKHSASAR